MKRWIRVFAFVFLFMLYACNGATVSVSFETNGGSVIETITSEADLLDGIPETSKTGYAFDGWFEDAALTIPFSVATERESWEFTLYAKWSLLPVDLTVEHYLETLTGGYELHDSVKWTDFYLDSVEPDDVDLLIPGFSVMSSYTLEDDDRENVVLKLYYDRNIYRLLAISSGLKQRDVFLK